MKSQAPAESENSIRLDLLERKVQSLMRDKNDDALSFYDGSVIKTIGEYRNRLKGGSISVEEGKRVTAAALKGGVKAVLIEKEIRKIAHKNELADEILVDARKMILNA